MKSSIKVFSNILFYGVLCILIVFLLFGFIAKKSGQGFKLGSYRAYDILTGSMSPTIKPGSLVVVKEVSPNEIKENDIITFKSDITNNITTHRAIEVNNNGNITFVTKGDANNSKDPAILTENNIIGKVMFQIPYVGGIIRYIQENLILCVIMIVVLVVLIEIIPKVFIREKQVS
ncbi:TPA: signal peptidase I [Clostridium perfringens]